MYLREDLGCSFTLDDLKEHVPRWALPFARGNMPVVQMPTMTVLSNPFSVAAGAAEASLELCGVPPSNLIGSSARNNRSEWHVINAETSVFSTAPFYTMLNSETSTCSASISSASCSNSSSCNDGNGGGGDGSTANSEAREEYDEFECETVEEKMNAVAFLHATQNGEAGRGFLALGRTS